MSRFFFFKHPATTVTYTLSLHDALPICRRCARCREAADMITTRHMLDRGWWETNPIFGRHPTNARLAATSGAYFGAEVDRKSTRLNSSHSSISYAVFCLKKKNTINTRNV